MEIKEKIKNARKSVFLSQKKFADKLNVSFMTVRRWESGDISPRLDELEKISKTFNIPLSSLIELNDKDKNSQLFDMVQQTSARDIPSDNPFTAGIDKNKGTMTFRNGEQEITVPFDEKLFAKIFQTMLNNNSPSVNNNNNFSITGTGNSGKQIIGSKETE